ncbi:helix-turn-helix transcriptional regulator [Larkinella insperata]|nr:AraC family transcriptional regulator [Larkinella insperata]
MPGSEGLAADGFLRFQNRKAGNVAVKNIVFPHMQIMETQWETANDIELQDVNPSEGISINFMLGGTIDTQFRGIRQELNMRPGTHNLVHAPEASHRNRLKRGQSLSMLLVSLDKAFFMSAIGQDDSWSERILNELHHERPFSGISGTSTITPQMRHLIDDIRSCKALGPMRNLLIQSRVLELVALEIEQFKTPVLALEAIPADEVEKLHQLKRYLDANFLSDHSLAQLSRYCLLNEFKVKKGFKQLFNTTVFNYLRKLRMEHAAQLLRNYALSVDEVADRLGYEHAQHFSIAFKKYAGLTPSQYLQGKAPVRPLAYA